MKPQTIAAFDFDGTISRADSLLPFLRYLSKSTASFILRMLRVSPTLFALFFRLKSSHAAKQDVLRVFVTGLSEAYLTDKGRQFSQDYLPDMVRESALNRLAWHREQGHRCVLVSASLTTYLKPWAASVGFDDVVCSELAFDERGLATGKLAKPNCKGQEKVDRLMALLGLDWPPQRLYAYGDSRGDRELLAAANEPHYRFFKD